MEFKWDYHFFRRNVTLGLPAIVLANHIVLIVIFVRRPEADIRLASVLAICLQDVIAGFEIGRICRTYRIDYDGITACWFGIFRRYYPWEDFCAVGKQNVFLGARSVDRIICSQIPLKIRKDGMVDKEWIAKHPIKVLDIELSENQYQEFFQYCSHDTD